MGILYSGRCLPQARALVSVAVGVGRMVRVATGAVLLGVAQASSELEEAGGVLTADRQRSPNRRGTGTAQRERNVDAAICDVPGRGAVKVAQSGAGVQSEATARVYGGRGHSGRERQVR